MIVVVEVEEVETEILVEMKRLQRILALRGVTAERAQAQVLRVDPALSLEEEYDGQ